MTKQNLTYVSAYLNIYDEPNPSKKANAWRINHFRNLVSTGINICLYFSPDFQDELYDLAKEYPNLYLMPAINIEETWVYKTCQDISGYTLPNSRNLTKDTEKYLILQNSKTDFLRDAIEKNPFGSTHFAWIDFSIAYIFKNLAKSQKMLTVLAKTKLPESFFAIPGCWNKWDTVSSKQNMNTISWRFCGGFFIGSKNQALAFCNLHRELFPRYLKEYGKLTWEVNIWAYMEYIIGLENRETTWAPTWFSADHDDRIIQIPNDFLCSRLAEGTRGVYPYPEIKNFQPSSAAYIFHNGRHWLNTRYVNYHLTDKSYYIYLDKSGIIKNKNVITELVLDIEETNSFLPVSFTPLDESTCGLEEKTPGKYSVGLEDIRLFVSDSTNTLRFIATNLNYSPCGKNRMVVGDFSPETASYSNCAVIIPPNPESWCEKNWIPLHDDTFIYKWSPMEIGKIIEKNDEKHLEIFRTFDINIPFFHKIRGSTIFTPCENGLLGVVHFSEEGNPRHYYHALVLLDLVSKKPLRYSLPFYFEKVGVEFCIGFAILKENYVFWISRMDRDPLAISISKTDILVDMEI
jgi:hypothetical protein